MLCNFRTKFDHIVIFRIVYSLFSSSVANEHRNLQRREWCEFAPLRTVSPIVTRIKKCHLNVEVGLLLSEAVHRNSYAPSQIIGYVIH